MAAPVAPAATDVLVVGAGPAGSAAAAWAARHGPRRRPRRRRRLPPGQDLRRRPDPARDRRAGPARPRRLGARARAPTAACARPASARCCSCPGPAGRCPTTAARCRAPSWTPGSGEVALKRGAVRSMEGAQAVDVERDGDRVTRRRVRADGPTPCGAGGWSSPTAPGPRSAGCSAASGTATPPTASPPAATSSPAAATTSGSPRTWSCAARTTSVLSGYGWVFPLDDGEVNIGVGTLATDAPSGAGAAAQPDRALRRRAPRGVAARRARCAPPASALLPMGGAVSGVAGRNWALIGDAAGLRQPAQRRGHRLRPGDRAAGRRAAGRRAATWRRRGPRPCAATTARRSPSRGGWPACSPCRGCCRSPGRWGCGRGR